MRAFGKAHAFFDRYAFICNVAKTWDAVVTLFSFFAGWSAVKGLIAHDAERIKVPAADGTTGFESEFYLINNTTSAETYLQKRIAVQSI